MLVLYKKRKKYNEIQLTENKMDLNNRKIKNHKQSHTTVLKKNYSKKQQSKSYMKYISIIQIYKQCCQYNKSY